MTSARGKVGKTNAANVKTANARRDLLNPPCPHDKTELFKGKTRCVHCKHTIEKRGKDEVEAELAAMRERHADELAPLEAELKAMTKGQSRDKGGGV